MIQQDPKKSKDPFSMGKLGIYERLVGSADESSDSFKRYIRRCWKTWRNLCGESASMIVSAGPKQLFEATR